MTVMDVPAEVQDVVRARMRRDLDELDYRRGILRLRRSGHTQTQIALWLGVKQPTVVKVLRTAERDAQPLEGFSGSTPLEICQRYAADFIDRDRLVDELVRFPYARPSRTDGYDTLVVDPPGAWSEVTAAHHRGLIDDDVYEEVFTRRHGLAE